MSELENLSSPFPVEIEDDGLDIDAIFGGSSADANPFEEAPVKQPEQPKAELVKLQNTEPAPAEEADDEPAETDLFSAFAAKATEKEAPKPQLTAAPRQTTLSLFDKPPVFSYANSKEKIEDASMTFEELRIAKAEDFPELAEGKRVSWTVEYGKASKYITDPKGTTIASVKAELEKSKSFLDGLKKAKDADKNPDCLVKPKVTAQSKGIASYKGIFSSVEEARASDKSICLFPARDGGIYELRKTEMGEFIAPKNNIALFSAVRAGFSPALPLIPQALIAQIISFFRCFMNECEEFEAMAHIYWNRENEEFVAHIPKQQVSKAYIDADLSHDILPEDRYLLYADVHSHNSMEAKFSCIDDADEKATRLYFVIGRLDRFYPSITARVSCGGTYQEIDPATVIESVGEVFPHEWLEQVTKRESEKRIWRAAHSKLGELPDALPEAMLV